MKDKDLKIAPTPVDLRIEPGTAPVLQGDMRSIMIDGVKYLTAGLDVQSGRQVGRSALLDADYGDLEQRVTVMKGSNLGKTEYRGGAMTWREWAESWRAPVTACDVCGCACRPLRGYTCNSCRDGMRAARAQLQAERMKRAFKTFEGACAAFGVSLSTAMEAMQVLGNLGPIMVLPSKNDAAFCRAFMAPDPMHVEVGGPESPWPRTHLVVYDEIMDFPGGEVTDAAEILRALRPAPMDFDFFGHGLMHQAFGRATRPEPRPKRDRRNRGPEQHGKWWQKGRRF